MNMFDIAKAKNIMDVYINKYANQRKNVLAKWFPDVTQVSTSLNYIVGFKKAPVMMRASEFGSDPLPRIRGSFELKENEIPMFRDKFQFGEKLRKQIRELDSTSDAYKRAILREYDDASRLLESADITPEAMRGQIFGYGKIVIDSNGVQQNIVYGFEEDTQLKTTTSSWATASSAKPITDITAWREAYKTLNKVYPGAIIMSDKVLGYIFNSQEMKDLFAKVSLSTLLVPKKDDARIFLETNFNLIVEIVDETYLEEDGATTETPIYPEDRITFAPAVSIGDTVYATAPEVDDKAILENAGASVEVYKGAIGLSTVVAKQIPMEVDLVCTMLVLPSITNAESILICKVITA